MSTKTGEDHSYYSPYHSEDIVKALLVDLLGDTYVASQSDVGYNVRAIVVLKYSTNGDTHWIHIDTVQAGSQKAPLLALGPLGSIFVAGRRNLRPGSLGDGLALTQLSPDGSVIWSSSFIPSSSDFDPSGLAVDGVGNAYVTGCTRGAVWPGYSDYLTMKFDTLGDTAWVRLYDGATGGEDRPVGIAVDSFGSVFVTGLSSSAGSEADYDYLTLKYDSSGDLLWERRFNGDGGGQDEPAGLVLDPLGNPYITGFTTAASGAYDCTTLKYHSSGTLQWVGRASDVGFSYSAGSAIRVDAAANVYVTGRAVVTGNMDYLTIKYIQCDCPLLGDLNADGVLDVFDIIDLIGVAFSGDPDLQDPQCPSTRGNVNGDGVTDVFDVTYLIHHVFEGGPAPVAGCV